jgi:putative transcriptional regulator
MNNLRKYREMAKLTQAQLGAVLDVGQGAVAHYEAGRRAIGLPECRLIVSAINKAGVRCTLDDVFPAETPKRKKSEAA